MVLPLFHLYRAVQFGWALKAGKQAKRFSEKQKMYLDQKVNIQQETEHKLDGVTVPQDMRYAKDDNGYRLFDASEFLTALQISSYFSRMASKIKESDTLLREQDSL
jgi:hypothetical protein